MKKEWLTREHDITIDEVKATEGLTHLTDEQAKEVISVIKTFSGIVYSLHKREIDGELDLEENIISLNKTEQEYKNAA
jgi:hypothetical protein